MTQSARTNYSQSDRGHTNGVTYGRWGALAGGVALAVYGLTRRSMPGVALAVSGGALAAAATRIDAHSNYPGRSSIQLNCSPADAFRFWSNFENLPLFMRHLESVTSRDNRVSRWTAIGPMGTRLTWDAEIVDRRENEYISWRSMQGSDIDFNGTVLFEQAPGGRGTFLSAEFDYRPPGGNIGRAVAKILGKDPSFLVEQDLRRMKALIETGEVPTVEGQSHGPRSITAAVARVANPDRPQPRENIFEAMRTEREAS